MYSLIQHHEIYSRNWCSSSSDRQTVMRTSCCRTFQSSGPGRKRLSVFQSTQSLLHSCQHSVHFQIWFWRLISYAVVMYATAESTLFLTIEPDDPPIHSFVAFRLPWEEQIFECCLGLEFDGWRHSKIQIFQLWFSFFLFLDSLHDGKCAQPQ